MLRFNDSGAIVAIYPLNLTFGNSFANVIGQSLDSRGQLWGLDTGLFALNTASGAVTSCGFESTDVNFGSATVQQVAVAGATVWIGVSGTADAKTYVFKVPAQLTSSGCDLTTLETPASEYELTPLLGQLDVLQISIDGAGNAYALQVSGITKITPGGQKTKLVDTGVNLPQAFGSGFTLDPSGAYLYLVDTENGALARASTTVPSTNPVPETALPPVLGLAGPPNNIGQYQPFFAPDGTLWIGAIAFMNPALPFTLLGSGGTYNSGVPGAQGGLAQVRVPRVTFAARAARAHDAAQILRKIHARQWLTRSRFRQRPRTR